MNVDEIKPGDKVFWQADGDFAEVIVKEYPYRTGNDECLVLIEDNTGLRFYAFGDELSEIED